MRIQHNIPAMNAYRNYTNNNAALSKNLEKLSSGYKINRAGDDAAGLAISEKMRAQITGLKTAQKNAKDGISLIQTAEGALTEVHDMLNRMVELADQSANGTYDNDVDRANLQKEFDALRTEINRIADSSNFNGIKLLDGSLEAGVTDTTISSQLKDINVSGGTNAANIEAKRVEAEAAITAYKVGTKTDGTEIGLANGTTEAIKITYTNKEGKSKTITFAEGDPKGVTDGTTLAQALGGGSGALQYGDITKTSAADVSEFRDLFNITYETDADGNETLRFQAKDASTNAEVTSVNFGSGADISKALENVDDNTVKKDDTATKVAESAGYSIDFDTTDAQKTDGVDTTNNSIQAGTKVQIGDTTYEFVEAGNDAASGNVAVTLGGNAADGFNDENSVANLVAQMKKDGIAAEVSKNDNTKVIISDLSTVSENQNGYKVSASTDKVQIDKQVATKEETKLTLTAGTQGKKNTFVLNYVDKDGKAQSKSYSYTVGADENADAETIANLLKNDADVVGMFEINYDAGNDYIDIKARGTGTDAGSISGAIVKEETAGDGASVTVARTAGKDEGKTVGFSENLKSGDTITIDGVTYEFSNDASKEVGSGNVRVDLGNTIEKSMENLSKTLNDAGVKHDFTKDGDSSKLVFADKNAPEVKEGGLRLQIGDTSDSFNQITVKVNDMHAEAMGIADLSIAFQDKAADAVEVLKNAINYVSSTRGDLGALQNRLEHTINNLSVMQENIQDAESTIRDTDVADEMMNYTKNNILVQSAQAMLAQANQIPQGVLQLLQ